MKYNYPELAALLLSNSRELPSGCWEWIKTLKPDGYGCLHYRRRSQHAHRLSYLAFTGDIEPGLEIDHLCRYRACINPDHLEKVTREENVRRARKTHCKRGHEYALHRASDGSGECMICKHLRGVRQWQREKARRAAA
jgi:HNH endonuclease